MCTCPLFTQEGPLTIEIVSVHFQACAHIANCLFESVRELFPKNGQTCLVIPPVTE